MKTLTVTIITLNEEQNIREALESVKWADEIVIVDAYSTDKTIEICKQYTNKIFQRAWTGYVDQKNYALKNATHNWVLSLDADERVSLELRNEIQALMNTETEETGYKTPRKSFFLGRWIHHTSWYPDYQLRLFNKTKAKWVGGRVHETVTVHGKIGYLHGDLLHYSYKNVSDYLHRLDRYSGLAAQDYCDKNKKVNLLSLAAAPWIEFANNYVIKQGFRDGYPGFVISVFSAISVFFKYVKLWELKKNRKKPISDHSSDAPSVLFIDTEKAWRGGQQQLLSLMLGLRKYNYDVSLVAQPESPLEMRAHENQIPVYPIKIRNDADLLSLYPLYQLFKSKHFDIVHYNTPRSIFLGTLLTKWRHVRLRISSRSVNFPLRRPLGPYKYRLGVDKIIAVSYSTKSALINDGIPAQQIEVVYEGIDLDEINASLQRHHNGQGHAANQTALTNADFLDPSRAYIGTVGTLTLEKGNRFLIEAAAEVCARYENLRVLIVGEGDLRNELAQLVQSLGLQDKVIFAGFREEFFDLMSSFKVFVLPSLSEGFGVVLLYAMAASIPLVATNIGGIPEIVEDKVTGLLVPPGNSKALAQAICYLIDHPNEASAMGRAGRKRLETHFTLNRKINQIKTIYETLLKNGTPRHGP